MLVPYSALERHGLIGNGETAALVAADGSVDWLCAPAFDGPIIFGALLDARHGGFWRVGPVHREYGVQRYVHFAPVLTTRWQHSNVDVSVTDVLLRTPALVRHVQCHAGPVDLVSTFQPHDTHDNAWSAWRGTRKLPSERAELTLATGQEVWLSCGPASWTPDDIETKFARTREDHVGAQRQPNPVLATAGLVLQLLQYDPTGTMVAAPTTSIPERIGGGWNVDYRLTWVRDTSIAMTMLAEMGNPRPAERYLEWLTTAGSVHRAPLQTLYDVRGGQRPIRRESSRLSGYRESRPVRFGNHAYKQRQLDIFGYVADCAATVLNANGTVTQAVWDLLSRNADYVAAHWRDRDRSIWELPIAQHYVSSRVMSCIALERTIAIGQRLQIAGNQEDWQQAALAIRNEVLARGWNAARGAFVQVLDGQDLDASALLIAIYGFLPVSDPRVASTVAHIADELTIEGMVYRFDPRALRADALPMGEFEAAFIPCTLWLATVYRLLGRYADADRLIARVDDVAGSTGLLAEAIDPRTWTFAGNFPLAFSHAERVRAELAGPHEEVRHEC